jgi:uncharacterized repeat protein (TIGR03803 family)
MIAKYLLKSLGLVLMFLALGFGAKFASAQSDEADASSVTFTPVHRFSGTDGANPYAALVQATNGYLYGTTLSGGSPGLGTIFKITPSGAFTSVYNFCAAGCAGGDGINPTSAGLLQDTNGYLYGTSGGGDGDGTVFKINPSGSPIDFYSFCDLVSCPDSPGDAYGTLVQATNGYLYETSFYGGTNGSGTVFKITPNGAITTLYAFCTLSGCADGENPNGGLVQAINGDLYGTTLYGGIDNSSCTGGTCGTIFKITPGGTLTTLYSFCSEPDCTDGSNPEAALIQATNGDLYGTTAHGGANCSPSGCGTVFKITPGGAFTTLYSFCSQAGCPDGNTPFAPLIEAANGNLYGTTNSGGSAIGGGTIFKITPAGTLTTIYRFCAESGCPGGGNPFDGLVQATNGVFYGTTRDGGTGSCTGGCGTVFSLSTGQAPFVETRPAIGNVGAAVTILGYQLTGATSVTFNGTPATFTVDSSTEISTTVPTGATTGSVQVVTPSGTLSSNVPFYIP